MENQSVRDEYSPCLVDGAGDKAGNVPPLAEDKREGRGECWCGLYRREHDLSNV